MIKIKKYGFIFVYVCAITIFFFSAKGVNAAQKTCIYNFPANWKLQLNETSGPVWFYNDTIVEDPSFFGENYIAINTDFLHMESFLKDSELGTCSSIYYKYEKLGEGNCFETQCLTLFKDKSGNDSALKEAKPTAVNHEAPSDNNNEYYSKCDEYESGTQRKEILRLRDKIVDSAQNVINCKDLSTCSTDKFSNLVDTFESNYDAFKTKADSLKSKYSSCTTLEVDLSLLEIANLSESAEKNIILYKEKVQASSDISQEQKNEVSKKADSFLEGISNTDYNGTDDPNLGEETYVDCSTYNDLFNIVSEIYNIVLIMAPILLIVFGSLDFGKAILSNDQDALKKAGSNFMKRAIATICIFFLPFIVNLIFKMDGITSLVEGAFCEIRIK